MCFKNKTLEDIKKFIESGADFDNRVANSWVHETQPIAKVHNGDEIWNITIGIYFENSEGIGEPYELADGTLLDEYYIYNLFVGPEGEDEYVNIYGGAVGSIDDRLPESTLILIRDAIAEYFED